MDGLLIVYIVNDMKCQAGW